MEIYSQIQLDSLPSYGDHDALHIHLNDLWEEVEFQAKERSKAKLPAILIYNFTESKKLIGLDSFSYDKNSDTFKNIAMNLSGKPFSYNRYRFDMNECENYHYEMMNPLKDLKIDFTIPGNSSLILRDYRGISFINNVSLSSLKLLNIKSLEDCSFNKVFTQFLSFDISRIDITSYSDFWFRSELPQGFDSSKNTSEQKFILELLSSPSVHSSYTDEFLYYFLQSLNPDSTVINYDEFTAVASFYFIPKTKSTSLEIHIPRLLEVDIHQTYNLVVRRYKRKEGPFHFRITSAVKAIEHNLVFYQNIPIQTQLVIQDCNNDKKYKRRCRRIKRALRKTNAEVME